MHTKLSGEVNVRFKTRHVPARQDGRHHRRRQDRQRASVGTGKNLQSQPAGSRERAAAAAAADARPMPGAPDAAPPAPPAPAGR